MDPLRCGHGSDGLRIRRIQCFGSSFRQLKQLWGKRRYVVRMALSYLMAVAQQTLCGEL
jgi:hypothetical protein